MNKLLMIGGPKETVCISKLYPGFANYTIIPNGKFAGIHMLQTLTISAYSKTDAKKSKTSIFKNVKGQVAIVYGNDNAVFIFISMNNLHIIEAKHDGTINLVTSKAPFNPITESLDYTMEMDRVNVNVASGGFHVSLESTVDKPEGDDYVTEGSRISIITVLSINNNLDKISGINIWHALRDSKYRGFINFSENNRTLAIVRGTRETIYYPLKPFQLSAIKEQEKCRKPSEDLYHLAS